MDLMPGYKQSDVGVIPDDWDAKPLGEIGDSLIGLTYRPSEVRAYGTLVLRSSNVQSGALCFDDNVFVDTDIPDRIMVRPGDILVCVRNGSRDLIGKSALIDERAIGMTFGAFMGVFRSEYGHFLRHVFQSGIFKKQINEHLGATINQITNKSLNSFKVPLPPTDEERTEIAGALSDVDALLATMDQLIAKKRDLKQAAMQQLLTGKIRLPGFGGEWEAKKLEHAGCCLRGVSYRGDDDLSPHDTAFTKRLLRSNNVQNAFVVTDDIQFVNNQRVSQDQVLQKNDILICMANGSKALVGKAGLFFIDDGFDYTFGAFMGCFRTDASIADPVFVFSLFQTGRYRDYINNLLAGSSINNLSPSSIESLEFSFPPYSEQVAIGRALAEMDAELSMLEYRRDKTHNLKQAMMQELLTGKTRLV
ncbi:restriction endonuclease subunit S [Aeromonas caviae]|uniref:restriction endonuclease subunit S n=2 Tax=Aeromonas TaxID=642 RepID=UPI00301523EE